jgi:hypothetical protein
MSVPLSLRERCDYTEPIAVGFEAYVERGLAPSPRTGQLVVMDTLGAHRPKRVCELIEERGCELAYLLAYSPDYDPMKKRSSRSRIPFCSAAARTKEAWVEAIGAFRPATPTLQQRPHAGAQQLNFSTAFEATRRGTRAQRASLS